MKVNFDYEIFYQQKYGGISSYYSNLGKELLKQNVDVNFICPVHKCYNLKSIPKDKLYGKKILYPNFFNPLVNVINFNLSKIINLNIKPDIVHRTYFSKNSYSKKVKNVITFYDVTHEISEIKNYKNENTKLIKKENINKADHILCISKTVKNDLINYLGVSEKKISVTLLSSDYKKKEYSELNKKKKLQNFFLYVGNRSGYKNFENFISAYALSKKLQNDFRILIFGGEKSHICGKDIILKNKLPINSFKFVNGTNEYLKYLYQNVRALIYPSIYEGFGIPLVEAMRSGCPFVSSYGGALREVGGTGINYFNPSDKEDIKNKIEDMVYSEDNINNAINYGLNRCDKFSWSECARETLNAYKKVI